MNPHFFTAPFYFALFGSGLAPGAARPLITFESFD